MSKYTRRGREAARAAATERRPDLVAFLDGHRIAYADRRASGAGVRFWCGGTAEMSEGELHTPGLARARKVLRCDPCRVEMDRVERLKVEDPAAYEAEMRRLEGEGRGVPQ